MTIRIIRTASLGLPVGTIRTFTSGVEAALIADKEAVSDPGPSATPPSAEVTADAAGNLFANGVQIQSPVSGAGISYAALASTLGAAPGERRTLTDGPDAGAGIVWAIPEGSSTYAWCWAIYPLASYL